MALNRRSRLGAASAGRAAGFAVALAILLASGGCTPADDGSAASADRASPTGGSAVSGSSAETSSTVASTPATPPGTAGGASTGGSVDRATGEGPDGTTTTGALGGAGGEGPGTDVTASGDGATESAATLSYSNADYQIEFSYPADWRLTEDISAKGAAGSSAVGSVGAFHPRGTQRNGLLLDGVVVSIYQLPATVDSSLLPVFEQEVASILPELEAHLSDLLVVEPLRPTSVNGLSGFETTYSFTQDGQELRNRMLFLVSGDIEYQITVQGAAAAWDALQPSFEVVVRTFRSTR